MIMPGIELSVIPRIDISTRCVTDGKEGAGFVSSQSDRGTYPPPLEAATINSSTLNTLLSYRIYDFDSASHKLPVKVYIAQLPSSLVTRLSS
ncbi:hypothetical protein ALC56_11444 [Trachymyrmex septentrionalis]|uniref:Uncharacterized protein n=1 Tax=Trachymyrmex septentrionalis TaxID=34720 RepID=A0A195F2D4_9HYME|nr:hypothetical protein ALC56_11444 [Trachymyrmex septentrionalis]